MQKFPLAPTMVAPTCHIDNKHLTFSLNRKGTDQEIRHETPPFFNFSHLKSAKLDENRNDKPALDPQQS